MTELPPDFDFIASKTDDEKIDYIQSVLARSEDEAIAVIAPALRFCGTAGAVVEAYLPLLLEVKKHVCRPGRPKVNPTTGERNKTWEEICNEHFHIGIRRMQQVLASLKEPKLSGKAGTTSRRAPIDRKEYERARNVAAPARSLAEAVVKQGMGDKFPEALEILKLADIPVSSVQPVAITAEVSKEIYWKTILTELVTMLEQYGDRLPIPVIKVLKSTQELLDGKAMPQAVLKSAMVEAGQNLDAQSAQFPPTKPIAATPQDAGPLDVASQDVPQAAAAPSPKRGRRAKASKPVSSSKVTVCPAVLSPEEEERKSGTLDAASGHPVRRQGDSVLNEEGKREYEPEKQQLSPAKLEATDPKPFRVKTRIQGDFVDFAILRNGDKLPYEVFDTESEARTVCKRLNTPPVASGDSSTGKSKSSGGSARPDSSWKTSEVHCLATRDGYLKQSPIDWGNAGSGGPTGYSTYKIPSSPRAVPASSWLGILETKPVPQKYNLTDNHLMTTLREAIRRRGAYLLLREPMREMRKDESWSLLKSLAKWTGREERSATDEHGKLVPLPQWVRSRSRVSQEPMPESPGTASLPKSVPQPDAAASPPTPPGRC